MRWRNLVGAIIVSAFAIAAAGCKAELQTNQHSEWIKANQAVAEYRDEAAKLKLAPGWEWPSQVIYDEERHGMEALYGVNTGRIDAAWYWHCSWGRQYLGETDLAKRAEYLPQVLALRDSAFFKLGLAVEDRPAREDTLNRLASGDVSEFRNIIEVNCPANSEG
ncbi:hypothetical protein [Micromonospora zamorensis]|uniref:hypothetical protein n=1 Tax=Micromonospora zamorensis TaxID=709883 RepID=UPI0033C2BA60